MLFFDFSSGRFFMKDENVLSRQLKELEERGQRGEILLWDEYYQAIGLPEVSFGAQAIGSSKHNYVFEFELLPSEDCTVIYVNR